MDELVFGKDKTSGVVSVEPSPKNVCRVYVQNEEGQILEKEWPNTHWLIYTGQHSPKMTELAGDQPYKWLMDYDDIYKYRPVLNASREKNLDYYTCHNPKEAFLIRSGVTYYKGLKIKDVAVLSFDLEHTYGIGDSPRADGRLLLVSNTFRDSSGRVQKKLFAYDDYPDEAALIQDWCQQVREWNPSIILGHNIFGHDLKILKFAAARSKAVLALGRNGSAVHFDQRPSAKRKDGSQAYDFTNAAIYGREIVDTFFLALSYDIGRNYESYNLKQIIRQEGLEKKDRVHYDASKIPENFRDPQEWQKIKEYCIDDADDALALWDLMGAAFFYATQSIPRSLQHVIGSGTGGQINAMMVRGYLQQGHSVAKAESSHGYGGAISFGIPGLHRNVLRFDVSSLYPSIIRQYKIYHPKKDPRALFLKLVNYFTEERLGNKRKGRETGDRYYKDLEQSQKILINSMYGFMGTGSLNYNYYDGADKVTAHGRRILKNAIYWATGKEFEGVMESTNEDP